MKSIVLFAPFLALLLTLGCKPPECEQLVRCCDAAQSVEGVGKTCGLAKDLSDPKKCRSITQAMGYLFESKNLEIPAACRLEGDDGR